LQSWCNGAADIEVLKRCRREERCRGGGAEEVQVQRYRGTEGQRYRDTEVQRCRGGAVVSGADM
jgi:hypothetical protein